MNTKYIGIAALGLTGLLLAGCQNPDKNPAKTVVADVALQQQEANPDHVKWLTRLGIDPINGFFNAIKNDRRQGVSYKKCSALVTPDKSLKGTPIYAEYQSSLKGCHKLWENGTAYFKAQGMPITNVDLANFTVVKYFTDKSSKEFYREQDKVRNQFEENMKRLADAPKKG